MRPLLSDLGSQLRTLRRVVSSAALALAAGLVAFLAAGIATGGWRVLPVLSGSMEPAFGRGDAVLVSRAPLASVRVGDVIAYRVPVGDRQLTTHRVVRVLAGGDRPVVQTKGDANAVADPWRARLGGDLWRVETALPHAGVAYSNAARTTLVWAAVAAGLAFAVRRLWRRDRVARA